MESMTLFQVVGPVHRSQDLEKIGESTGECLQQTEPYSA